MRFLLAVVLYGVGTLSAAPVPKDFKKQDDSKSIIGTWKAHALTINGRVDTSMHTHTFVFEADGKCHTLHGQGQRSRWTYTLDPKATPKRMKWVNDQGNSTYDCVYLLEGDTFKLGFITGKGVPPMKVEPAPDLTLYETTRVKDAK